MSRAIAVILCLVSPALAGAQAAPAHDRFSVAASLGAGYVTDRSLDFIGGTDAMTVGEVRVGYAPGWRARHLELQLGYTGTSEGGTTFQSYATSLSIKTLQLGLAYRRPLGSWFSAYGRLAGLFDFDRMEVTDASGSGLVLGQTTHTGGALVGAGMELQAPPTAVLRAGLFVELAYAQRFSAAHFDGLQPDVGGAKPAPVAFTPVDAGSVNLSGLQWRMGAVLHF